jgi:DNA polymerase I-like protein with 3'-5' exonuclease and polymerase domains
MTQKISYGACKQCGKPILYEGAGYCSPQCQVSAYARPETLSFDTETALIEPGRLAPPLACAVFAWGEQSEVVHHTEARDHVVAMLESDSLVVGHNVAYDMAVSAAEWPELLPLIFEVYAEDRVTDTMLREKLLHIAQGIYRRYERTDGTWVHLDYSLEAVVKRRLKLDLIKGEWQLRFGELRDTPMLWWPEEAKEYALSDAVATLTVWEQQESARDKHRELTGQDLLADEFRQSRAAFWLYLMSCWGLHTDEQGVREFARSTQQKYDLIAKELVLAGLMRPTGSRNIKAVQERVVRAYTEKKRVVPLTDGGQTGNQKPKTDADTCERSGDPVLAKYAELSSLKTMLSTYIPLLETGTRTPIQPRFESLLETGRTSSSPNVQNLPTDVGVRECFVPRPGKVFAIGDYSGMELRTWAQVCLYLFGESEMAKALNSGMDPHTRGAAMILGIPYEQAVEEYAADPKGRVYLPRQAMKSGNFGFPGGAGIARFRDYARTNYGVLLSDDEAKRLKDFWQQSWPESRKYANWMAEQCKKQVVQIEQIYVGRFRGDVSYTEGSNSMFQGLAADAAKNAGFLIARACYAEPESVLYGGRPVDFVHDEFLVEVNDDERAHDCAVELARLMVVGASPFLPNVPPKVEPLLARRWSKKAKPVHGPDGRLIPWDLK